MSAAICVVGLGPGEEELLTLRAEKLIRSANILIHAYGTVPAFLRSMNRSAKRWKIGVAASPIHQAAEKGLQVVVTAMGDPLSHWNGRGLISFLHRVNKLSVRFVPGVHTAFAAFAEKGLVPTHRTRASSLSVGYPGGPAPKADTVILWKGHSRKYSISAGPGKRQLSRFPNHR